MIDCLALADAGGVAGGGAARTAISGSRHRVARVSSQVSVMPLRVVFLRPNGSNEAGDAHGALSSPKATQILLQCVSANVNNEKS